MANLPMSKENWYIPSAQKVKQYLSQPYPYYWGQRKLYVSAFVLLATSFVFNYAFQPFVVYVPEHKMDFLWICLVHSVLPAIILYDYFSAINAYGVTEENWTLGKEVLHVGILLLFIGIGNFLIRDIIYDNPYNWSFRYFFEEIRNTYMVGALIILILVPINFDRLFRKHKLEAAMLQADSGHALPFIPKHHTVFIQTQVKADDFHLDVRCLLFARVTGNYVEFSIKSGGEVQVLLKRISMKELERQLSPFAHIIKTHRAFLVNLHMIHEVRGNAQGYRLSFDLVPETVPVARGMIEAFNSAMGQPT